MTGESDNFPTDYAVPRSLRQLARLVRAKVLLRWVFIRYGITAAIFWTAFAFLDAGFRRIGLPMVAGVLLGIWLGAALPLLFYQLAIIVDMLAYAFLGNVIFYPILVIAMKQERERRAAMADAPVAPTTLQRAWGIALRVLSASSPLSCLSTWALIVVMRVPRTAHARIVAPMRISLERTVYESAWHHVFAR